jgi:hypothetical protein
MRRPARQSVIQQAGKNGSEEVPVQIPPLPKSRTLTSLAGNAQDIPAALKNKPIEPTPGLSGTLSFFFGGTGEERKEFKFRTPRTLQTSPWRKLVAGPAKQLLSVIFEAMATDMEKPEGIERLVQIVEEHIITVPDVLTDLLLEFSPELKKQENEIRNLAFDEEIAQAFITACKVAFPLASIQSLLRAGEAMSGTS